MATYYHVVDDVVENAIEIEPSLVDSLAIKGHLYAPVDEGFTAVIGESWSLVVDEYNQNIALTKERFADLDDAIDLAFAPVAQNPVTTRNGSRTQNPVTTRHGTRSIDD